MAQLSFLTPAPHPKFDGSTAAKADQPRLETALAKVHRLMSDGRWRSLAEIAESCDVSEAGASARLRDLRKEKFRKIYPNRGVNRRRRNGAGLWEYKVVI